MSFNELSIDELNFPLYPEVFPVNPHDLFLSVDEISSLITQIEKMSIDIHIHSFGIEV